MAVTDNGALSYIKLKCTALYREIVGGLLFYTYNVCRFIFFQINRTPNCGVDPESLSIIPMCITLFMH